MKFWLKTVKFHVQPWQHPWIPSKFKRDFEQLSEKEKKCRSKEQKEAEFVEPSPVHLRMPSQFTLLSVFVLKIFSFAADRWQTMRTDRMWRGLSGKYLNRSFVSSQVAFCTTERGSCLWCHARWNFNPFLDWVNHLFHFSVHNLFFSANSYVQPRLKKKQFFIRLVTIRSACLPAMKGKSNCFSIRGGPAHNCCSDLHSPLTVPSFCRHTPSTETSSSLFVHFTEAISAQSFQFSTFFFQFLSCGLGKSKKR